MIIDYKSVIDRIKIGMNFRGGDDTYDCVFYLSIHEKSSMFIRYKSAIFACKYVCETFATSAWEVSTIFAGSKICFCNEGFAHRHRVDGSPSPSFAFHYSFQLLKITKS